jgi:hypothetical protein
MWNSYRVSWIEAVDRSEQTDHPHLLQIDRRFTAALVAAGNVPHNGPESLGQPVAQHPSSVRLHRSTDELGEQRNQRQVALRAAVDARSPRPAGSSRSEAHCST